jgi:hypothetical protein
VYPNYTTAPRTATINVGAQAFNVSQAAGAGTSNERFVGQMYFNFFGRLPAPSEVAYHAATLASLSRADLIVNFMNSPEFNSGGRFIAGLYVGLLNRNAEYSGWLFQRNAMATGVVNPNQLVQNFLDSAEWKLNFGSPDNLGFVRLLYRYILLREASDGEAAFQAGALASITRAQLASNLLNSDEFRNGTGPRLTAFLLHALVLLRDPTDGEMNARMTQIGTGTPVKSVVEQIVNSPEFTILLN